MVDHEYGQRVNDRNGTDVDGDGRADWASWTLPLKKDFVVIRNEWRFVGIAVGEANLRLSGVDMNRDGGIAGGRHWRFSVGRQ